jgi:hypothetical protein
MRRDEPSEAPLEPAQPQPAVAEQPQPAVAEQPAGPPVPRRSHLVVVVTRPLDASDAAGPGEVLRARHWNPYEHRWSERDYDGVESLRRRHIEEEGWELLQEQRLDAPLAVELIFRAHRIDFTRPSRAQILRDIGMTPDDVDQLLEDVSRKQDPE